MTEKGKIYVNIGLVGSVQNGKTTLVQKLTGVNTKRNSREIKSGRTIKLGYANCLVWKCPICELVRTTGQEQTKMECCSFDLEPVQYVSFVDAPGHHQYIQTMMKGASIIDCAIIVNDVREGLQIQTQEHLAILEIMGVKNVLVVQNKIDLVSPEQCIKHRELLQNELKGTVADGAPIIPISAQSGIGIEAIQDYIYQMAEICLKNMSFPSYNIFSIVRSFDINHPNTGIENLKGGVLGGTVVGHKGFSIGDEIEIRPGYIRKDNKCVPLKTKILSIFSESKKCVDTGRGGLYGIGTRLDPTLTKADRLVGCVAGFSEDLPPIISEMKMKVLRMKKCLDGTEPPKIKNGLYCQLIIGNTVIRARMAKSDEMYTALFDHPICVTSSRCLIYSVDTGQLIGFGMTNVSEPSSVKYLEQTLKEYKALLPTEEQKEKQRVTLPFPSLARENMNTIWSNVSVFCQVVGREQDHVATFIKNELCMEISVCQMGLRLYKTRMNVNKLQTVLKRYLKENVQCEQCKGIKTDLEKNSVRGYQIHCSQCGSTRNL